LVKTPRLPTLALVACAALLGTAAPAVAQTTYTWNDSTTDWTQAGAWTPAGPDWFQDTRLADALAAFGNRGTIFSQPSIGSATLFARGVALDNTGADWNLFGTSGRLTLGAGGLTLTGGGTTNVRADVALAGPQTWNVGSGGSVNVLNPLSGVTTLTKAGAGTLVIDNPDNSFTGTIAITGGSLLVGGPTHNAGGVAIRNAAIDFGANAGSIAPGGGGAHIRMGQVSGSNVAAAIVSPSQIVHMTALADAAFSGSVSMEGLNLFGTATQTFNGNTTALRGTVSVHGRAGLTLAGTGNATSGAISATSIVLRGGTLTLDNTGGNTQNAVGRLSDAALLRMVGGGTLRLVGNAADGSTENLKLEVTGGAAQVFFSGAHTIRVDHNGGAGGTVLGFDAGAANFTLRPVAGMTVDFVGTGGALGAAGANPRIVFTGAGQPVIGTVTGLLSDASGSDAAVGWATVNGTEWAGHGANGIVAVAPTRTSGTAAGIQAATATDLVVFNPSSNQTLTGSVTAATFKITPNGAASLSVGANNLNASAIMLAGANDFAITGTTGTLFGSANNIRYAHVVDPGAVLTTNLSLAGQNLPFTKSGAGTLALTGTANQLGFTSNQSIYIVQGTLRGTTAALGGGGATGGAFTTINLRGGVLEIDGAGAGGAVNYTRAITTSSGGAGGGVIRFGTTATERGEGGFSAVNAPGGVNVTLVTTVGGSTRAALQWNASTTDPFLADGYALLFGSPHSDSRVALTNNVALDGGTATAYVAREVRVTRGTGGVTDMAQITGVVTGSSAADLLKTGDGVLELTALNSYRGNTLVRGGALLVAGDLGLSGGEKTGNVVVGKGALFGGTGRVVTDVGKSVVVNPGGAIRGGSPVTTILGEHTGTLTVAADVGVFSTGSDRGTLQFEAHRTGTNAAAGSKLALADGFNLNLNPGAGNQFAVELVRTSVTTGLTFNESYAVTIASVGPNGNIKLNGVNVTGVIDPSNYVLQSTAYGFASYSLEVVADGSGNKNLQLTFVPVPVPEPAAVLGLAVLALGLGRARRRARSAV
jgi:fibronectin-binding autotransporter adhesin